MCSSASHEQAMKVEQPSCILHKHVIQYTYKQFEHTPLRLDLADQRGRCGLHGIATFTARG